MYDLRLTAILTANDDGSQAATPSPSAITTSVNLANEVFNPHGVNFVFDQATDIYRFNDDLLNRDCSRRDHEVYTDANVDPANNPALDVNLFNDRRNEVARRFPGRLVVFFTAGSRYRWDQGEGRWVYGPRTYSWSNHFDEFVTMASWAVGNDHLAHEIGHYLHLPHTFGHQPESFTAAVELIRKFVDQDHGSPDAVPSLFDGDDIADTPSDPGPRVFTNPCDPAETSVHIPVVFANGSQRTYTLTPDRENIMNYWDKTCRGGRPRITNEQANKVHNALSDGNRRHLIEPAVLYFGVWSTGDRSQTRALGWAMNDFAGRFNRETNANRRCVHLQAIDIGSGQIRYDGVWEQANGVQQTYALGWAMDHFAKRFDDELAAGRRCVHMQTIDIGGGQIRYDGVWESGGNREQSRALGWAIRDFIGRCDQEASAGKRLVHLQAIDIGSGQIRYDGVWEKANSAQQRVLGLPLAPFADHFDERTSGGFHVEIMTACRRAYAAPVAMQSVSRSTKVRPASFGSDFDVQPARLDPVPAEPLTVRGPGCNLGDALYAPYQHH